MSDCTEEDEEGEEVDFLVADVENERRHEEWKREQNRLKQESRAQSSASGLIKDRPSNNTLFFHGQRLKGRWEVKRGR